MIERSIGFTWVEDVEGKRASGRGWVAAGVRRGDEG
jgi:hypothetical protein